MLTRLTLVTTYQCNLNCSYCYAAGGNYGLPLATMSAETARRAIRHFADTFGGFKEILYFGGEPLLACPTIDSACEFADKLHAAEAIPVRPKYILVTNGTRIDSVAVDLLKRYEFSVTVSIDGPPAIHDKHRRFSDGNPTFPRVLEGISQLKEAGIKFSTECTYTVEHFTSGYSPLDIYKYLRGLGAASVVITEEMAAGCYSPLRSRPFAADFFGATVELINHACKEFSERGELGLSELKLLYDSILHRPEALVDNFCGAGRKTFTVSPEGLAYPCHILNGMPDYCLGPFENVDGECSLIPKKTQNKYCPSCELREICRACPARVLATAEDHRFEPAPIDCEFRRSVARIVATSLASIICDGSH